MRRTLAALAFALVALACGGGGGGGGGGTNPGPSIVYTAGTGPGTSALALVAGGPGSSSQLLLNLDARSVSNLFGVGFDLTYPGVLTFVGVTKGAFFPGSTSLQVNSTTPGRLIVGLSRLGSSPGVSGSGTLLTIEFRGAGGAGGGALGFENNKAFDATAKPIAGITWLGGDVTVTP